MRRDILFPTRQPGRALAAMAALFFLAACGDDSSNGTIDPVETVASVTVSPSTDTIYVGDTLRLAAVARSSQGSQLERVIGWATDAPGTVAVSSRGVARAIATGTATISASSEGKLGIARLTVAAAPSDSGPTDPGEPNQPLPAPVPVLASIAPSQIEAGWSAFTLVVRGAGFAVGSKVEWDGQVLETVFIDQGELRAQVSASDVATARTLGVRVLTPAPGGGASSASTFRVYVRPAAAVRFVSPIGGASWGFVNDRVYLRAEAVDVAGRVLSGREFTWASSDTSVVFPTESGGMLARKPGRVTITASLDGKTATTWVTAYARPQYDLIFDANRGNGNAIYIQQLGALNSTANPILLPIPAYDPSPSPDGARIAFQGISAEGQSYIYVVNRNGSGLVRLSTGGVEDQPAWSPDGSRIAFRSTKAGWADIWVMNADGSNEKRLTKYLEDEVRVPEDMHADPAWSPDGTKIAYARTWGIGWSIFVMNADGTGHRALAPNTITNDREPAWRADGQALHVRRVPRGGTIPHVAEISAADGSTIYRINYPHVGESPALTPDGQWMAYSGALTPSATREVILMPSTGADQAKVYVSALYGGGARPSWIRRR